MTEKELFMKYIEHELERVSIQDARIIWATGKAFMALGEAAGIERIDTPESTDAQDQ